MLGAVLHSAKDLRIESLAERDLDADEVRVKISFGGICGSDLSYFNKGRVGDFAVEEPMTLGHEVSGEVVAIGRDVKIALGTRIAVDPARACLKCDYCLAGRANLCRNMRFLGSAAVKPHVQGGFSQSLVVREDQCVPIPAHLSLREAACAEPLSVALHGVRRAGAVAGKHVLITGVGPIGLLCVQAVRNAGAATITVTDIVDETLALAKSMGANKAINILRDPRQLKIFEDGKGYFDIALEASGAPSALASLFRVVRSGGRIVQLGMLPPGDTGLPVNLLQAREIELVGSFRAQSEFRAAVEALASGQIDVKPIMSQVFALRNAVDAFAIASDRTKAIKVHLSFD